MTSTETSTTPEQLDDCIAKAKQAFATWKNVDDQKIGSWSDWPRGVGQ
ncbi:hypothetical protein R5M72_21110 [Acinetobacter baumannii]|nr:hypothetical protein [Acinetobacter baumannii]